MDALIAGITATDLFTATVGLALLIAGRKLYWLALGGLGFFLGLGFANHYLDAGSSGLELGLAFLAAAAGAVLAVVAQRMAIALGGLVLGGLLVYWTAAWLVDAGHLGPGFWQAAATIFGALIGTFLAAFLFEVSLAALTSLIGALLLTQAVNPGRLYEAWIFLFVFLAGVLIQTGAKRRRRRE